MNEIKLHAQLEPKEIWYYFEKICQIPRASKNEGKIIQYLFDFAATNHLDIKKDSTGNVLIKKPASKGMESKPIIVLQSHLDMVCEKNSNISHNFTTDPIYPIIDGDWIKARGTTLGADDGIGIAAQLALLSSSDIQHGTIECLFTIDEETGLSGANNLEPGFFDGKILLNLDSEDEGIIFIGCAGGIDTVGNIKLKLTKPPDDVVFYRINVSGLQGGHSGDDINKGLGNAIKIVARIVWQLFNEFKIYIVNLEGGNLRNAISREAYAEIAFNNKIEKNLLLFIESISSAIKSEFRDTDNNIQITFSEIRQGTSILEPLSAKLLLNIIYGLPHGATGMSHVIKGLVETSTNLASVKRIKRSEYEIATNQRSSSISLRDDIVNSVSSIFLLGKIEIKNSTGYPGWKPNPSSPILQIAKGSYKQIFRNEPIVTAIHAGLECGLFLEKFPDLDMISFGPTIKGAHSPDERLEIESVNKFWKFLLEILKNVS